MNPKIKTILIYLLKGITTGLVIGLVVGVYQLLALKVVNLSDRIFNPIYEVTDSNRHLIFSTKLFLIVLLVIMISLLLAYIINKLLKKVPYSSGSGIPQIEAYIRGKIDIKWYKALPMMFFGSLYSFFIGLGLGSEGPSVQIGASIGIMMNDIYKQQDDMDNIGISSGTGFGCAFLSPIAGIVYVFEESLHHFRFNILLIIRTIVTVYVAYFISRLINKHKILDLMVEKPLGIKYYYVILIIVVVSFISSFIFKKALIALKDFINKNGNNVIIKNMIYIVVVLAVIIGFSFESYSGSGAKILSNIPMFYHSLKLVLALMVFRLIYTVISGNSKLPGGLLVPQFCIGALNGLMISILLNKTINLDESYYDIIIFLSTLAMFMYVTHSPLTAIALGITHISYEYVLIPLIIISILGIFLIKLFKDEDMYELLIKRL